MLLAWHTQQAAYSSVNYEGEHGCSVHATARFRIWLRQPVLVQTFVPEFAIQAFHKGILRRLSWLDKAQCDTRSLTPEKHCLAGKFCPIVASNLLGFASLFDQLVQESDDLPTTNGHRD